ncbi:MAG: sulfite exporter TauE/SafE family protein [Acidimicrobiales bacterium]
MSLVAGIAAIVVGFLSGVLSGMFGIGGGALTTPGIRLLGATPIEAVGSTIPAILPGSLSGAWRYRRAGLIDWRVAAICGAVGSGMAVAGGLLSDHVNAHYLMLLTAALLLWSGIKTLRSVRAPLTVPVPGVDDGEITRDADLEGPEMEPGTVAVAAVGALSGLLAGLLGVGGGVVMVPAFTTLLHVSPKRAVATSLVAVAVFSIPAVVTHAALGHIHWGFALCLLVGVVPGAQLGAHLTIGGSERRLRLLMGIFFTVLALGYGLAELRSL